MRRFSQKGIEFIKNMDWAETLRYLIIGLCTTVVNFFVFWLMTERLGMNELVANIIAWIASTLFAFFTNCLYVFRMKPESTKEYLSFGAKFFGGRLFTLGLEELLLFIFITLAAWPVMPVKIAATCVTIALNYFISKLMIFIRREDTEKETDD